jgi:TolB-like protein/Flp pilus assembly protein TadD
MGVVYRATDNKLGRDVALKFPIEALLNSPRMLDAFEREARAAAALNHPNICTVYGVGEQDGRPFIAMELVEGETLEAILSRRELSMEEVVAIAIQVASALDAAHSRGIVHRDIKPSNIFVSVGQAVKVVDFGIAKCPTEVALSAVKAGDGQASPALSTAAGTPRYMAPEQLEGHAADARSDIFSFGVTLYEMITRRRPFEGDEPEALAAAIRSSPLRPVEELRAGVPRGIARILNRCLQTDPAARWETANELVTELRSISVKRQSRKWAWACAGAVAVVGLILAGALYWRTANAASINSIAVLPFTAATRDADTEYIRDGITEGIINSLSAAPGLKVIARTTAFTFKDKEVDPQAVGRQLGVQAVLTGKISQRGDSIFIQTDLVNVADRAQLWGEHFRRSTAAIQSLQTDIAGEIADKLRLRLAGEERKRVTKSPTASSEAFHLYLKAVYAPDVPSETAKGIELLEQAIAKDPGFAQAYVALGRFYRLLHEYQAPAAILQKSREAITKALDLDPSLAEAHVELAMSLWSQDWDWAGAEREFQRALKLNASIAHARYGMFLAEMGRRQEARIQAQRAVEIDPLSPRTLIAVMQIYGMTRDYDQWIEATRRAGPAAETLVLPFIAAARGQYEEAIAAWEKPGNENVGIRGHLGHAYAMAGRQADARRILRDLQARAQKDGVGAYEIGFIYAALGNKDEAFKWLDVAYRHHDAGLKFLKTDPTLDFLRSDPRFQELERRVGFPQ